MATDEKKKKIQNLLTSIERLSNRLILSAGNKRETDSIKKMIARFEADIKNLKAGS